MTRKPCPAELEQQIATILALVATGERITIATAAERTGISADITTILAIQYAVTDEMVELVASLGQSRH